MTHLMKFNWDRLRYFYIVATEKSISAASKKLYRSQSTISRQISDLEYRLQDKLFERKPQGIILTDKGEFWYRAVKRFIEETNDLSEQCSLDFKRKMLENKTSAILNDLIEALGVKNKEKGKLMTYELFKHENEKKLDDYFEKTIKPRGFIHPNFIVCTPKNDWVDYAYNKEIGPIWIEKSVVNRPTMNNVNYFTGMQESNSFFITNVLRCDDELNKIRRHFLGSKEIITLAKRHNGYNTFLVLTVPEESVEEVYKKETPFLFEVQKQFEKMQVSALGL